MNLNNIYDEVFSDIEHATLIDKFALELENIGYEKGNPVGVQRGFSIIKAKRGKISSILLHDSGTFKIPATLPLNMHDIVRQVSLETKATVGYHVRDNEVSEYSKGDVILEYIPNISDSFYKTNLYELFNDKSNWDSFEKRYGKNSQIMKTAYLDYDRKSFINCAMEKYYGELKEITDSEPVTFRKKSKLLENTEELYNFFNLIANKVPADSSLKLKTLGTFRRNKITQVSTGKEIELKLNYRPDLEIFDWLNGKGELTLNIDSWSKEFPGLERDKLKNQISNWFMTFKEIDTDKIDILVNDIACSFTNTFPGFEGKNPKTGQPITVPEKKLLRVLFNK